MNVEGVAAGGEDLHDRKGPAADAVTGDAVGEDPPPGDAVRVVGVASSAGGLEALRQLLWGLGATDRLSVVVAQHVAPSHDSQLVPLLAPHSRLPVVMLSNGDAPRPGTVAVVPAGHDVVYTQGVFSLVAMPEASRPRPSASVLFASLAQGLRSAAVGVVLSGAGSDGASGLRDIKAAGGLTIVQDPATTPFDGMPRAAINAGAVDLVLPPDQIGPALLRVVRGEDLDGSAADSGGHDLLYAQIARLVRARTAFKLDEYKAGTVRRRIARRQGLLNLPTLAAYLSHLQASPDEAKHLVRDTFISVTSFFRDRDAWRALERAVGALVQGAGAGVLRCWVPGCATGEEAYSIAMVFDAALRDAQRADLQYLVFASDLDDQALEHARRATYPAAALADLPEPLRHRYVNLQGDVGHVHKDLRARVVFARQNLVDDPPFSRVDLISCRNLLIYLNPPVQRRVLELFHYALRPGGQLFLGRSEALDGHPDLFTPVDPAARLYLRLDGHPQRLQAWQPPGGLADTAVALPGERRAGPPPDTDARQLQAQLLQRYAPPSLLLDAANQVTRFEGALKPFLDFPSGGARLQLFDMVDASVRAELRALVVRCRRDRVPVQGAAHVRDVDGLPHDVRVHVEPLAHDAAGQLLVSFVARLQDTGLPAQPQPGVHEAAIVAELERELADTRQHLVVVVDELQSANEQLQSANEELQSANEELQSTNEELRTVNEELQSANEELLTVNEELQGKSVELEATASMLTNVKQSLDFPLLVVDMQRCVLDANQACRRLARNESALQGLSLHALAWRFPIGDVDDDLQRVFDGGERIARELPGDDGQQFRLHVMPYRTGRQVLVGALLLFEDVTALRGAEDRYRQVTESLPQLVWTCDANGPCDYLSPQWVRYTGVPEAEQLGFGWLQQLHPDDRERAIERWTNTAAQGLDFEIEFRIRRQDGEYRWFHTQARPLRDAQGTIVKWYGSNTDIDDRKRAEGALKVAAETLEQRVAVRTAELEHTSLELARRLSELDDLYHNAPCGYHSTDPQGCLLRINDTELRWLGYTRDEMVGQPIHRFLTASGRETFAANYPRILAGETRTNLEVEWLRKDGSVVPMLVSATPVFDADGRYLYSRTVMLDHTQLRSQQRTLRRILAAAPMAVRIARLSDHRTVFVNEAFTELVNRSAEQAIDLDVRQFYVDKAAFDGMVQRLLAGEPVRNELVELRRPEDPVDLRWALVSFMTVDYEGERAVLAWLFDVTALQQAKRLAEQASQTKSRFLANMSHEIRTPMNGVIGMIDLARRDAREPQLAQRLHMAAQSARQLLAILNDILDFSKIEAGHMRLVPTPTDLADCLEGTRMLYDQLARDKGLDLVVDLAPALAGPGHAVQVDALRIRQVLGNLVANAIKFSPRGQVRLGATCEHTDAQGAAVRFEVSDQGPGIAPQDQARIFEMFEQVDVSAARRHEGTGLGLAICAALVAMMGGSIAVHSTPGQGSRFAFTLTLPWADEAPAPSPAPALAADLHHCAGAQVLMAEDNPINQEVQRIGLEDLGLQVQVVPDGRQAVLAALERRFDLIFMDMQMPGMNGVEATRAIRAGGPNKTTPIIAMTANAYDDDRRECLDAGMNDFLTKPLSVDDLPALVKAWLAATDPPTGAA